jgi:acetate---CoA ligase (ADP-forming)
VWVGIKDEAALDAAIADMHPRLKPLAYSVERMAPVASGVELLLGARRDRSFGPIVLVGAGGIYAELVRDVAVALAPVTDAQAEVLIRSLRIAPLLMGARGGRPLDVGAAARATAALSRLAAARTAIAEIEINPLLVLPHGALALDARIVS